MFYATDWIVEVLTAFTFTSTVNNECWNLYGQYIVASSHTQVTVFQVYCSEIVVVQVLKSRLSPGKLVFLKSWFLYQFITKG